MTDLYDRRTHTVEAFEWDGEDWDGAIEFFGLDAASDAVTIMRQMAEADSVLRVAVPGGHLHMRPGQWAVKEEHGRLLVMSGDDFARDYQPRDEIVR